MNGHTDGCRMAARTRAATEAATINTSTTTLRTLRGLFDEPKMNHRRDFLRENKLSLKELQRTTTGKMLQSKQEEEKRNPWRKPANKIPDAPTTTSTTNIRRSCSHQRLPGNDENCHQQMPMKGCCCIHGQDQNARNGGHQRRSRSYIRNTQTENPMNMKRNGYDNGPVVADHHCCCASAQSFSSRNSNVSKAESRDQEIQTEDICDEQFLYEALKRCSTNSVKNKILEHEQEQERLHGGDDNVSLHQNSSQYVEEEGIEPAVAASLKSNNISPRCPSERALSQRNYGLEENAIDTKSVHSHRTLDNVSMHSGHRSMTGSRCNAAAGGGGGGDQLDNKSIHTLYQADNRSHRSCKMTEMDNVSQCASIRSRRSKVPPEELASPRSQYRSEAAYMRDQMNGEGGGGDGVGTTQTMEYPSEVPASVRSRVSTNSKCSKKSSGGLTKASDREDVRLPRYLEKEKRAKEEERERLANRDPNCPFGHYPMDDDLRVEHLLKSQRRMNELIQELNRMPMTTETLRLRSRKREIEKELQQIETDIRLYSKPKVYLPIPSKKSPANYECLSSYCPESN